MQKKNSNLKPKAITKELLVEKLEKFTKDELIEICLKINYEDYSIYDCIEIMKVEKKYNDSIKLNKKIKSLENKITKIKREIEITDDTYKRVNLYESLIKMDNELTKLTKKQLKSNLHNK